MESHKGLLCHVQDTCESPLGGEMKVEGDKKNNNNKEKCRYCIYSNGMIHTNISLFGLSVYGSTHVAFEIDWITKIQNNHTLPYTVGVHKKFTYTHTQSYLE